MNLGTRDTLVRLENTVFDLMRRLDALRAAGVKIPQAERDAVAKLYRALKEQVNALEKDRKSLRSKPQKGSR